MSHFNTILVSGSTRGQGTHIVNALLDDGTFNVRVLTREASAKENAKVLDGFRARGATIVFGDYANHASLVKALTGVDVVISVVGIGGFLDVQLSLIAAAREAGVRRFIPSEWSIDTVNTNMWAYAPKKIIHQTLKDSGLEYTLFFAGVWPNTITYRLGSDYDNPTLTIVGDGTQKINFSDQTDIARWVVAALKHPELGRNREVALAGDRKTWNEVIEILERIVGHKFTVIYKPIADVERELKATTMSLENMPAILAEFDLAAAKGQADIEPWGNTVFDIGRTKTVEEFLREEYANVRK